MQDTWIWDGRTWTQRIPTTSPPAAIGAPLIYDSKLGRVVALIDQSGTTATWTWDGSTWAQLHPASEIPGPRADAAAAYDAATGSLVVFGRTVCTGPYQCTEDRDTWTFDGTNWNRHAAAPGDPPGRGGAAMAYDPSSKTIVLFGGGVSYSFLSDTWIWDGSSWTQPHPSAGPWARAGARALADLDGNRTILYGGWWSTQSTGSVFYDIWTWANGQWTLDQPTTGFAPPDQKDAILKAASSGAGLRSNCEAAPPPCMSVLGQAELGYFAAYVAFKMNPAQGQNSVCVSYVDRDQPDGPWHNAGVSCGPPAGGMPQLGAEAKVTVTGCANVRSFPQAGQVLACLPNGTPVTIDDGPLFAGSVESTGDYIWWHLQGRGWIAHQLLLPPAG